MLKILFKDNKCNWIGLQNIANLVAFEILENTAVVSLLATVNATSDIRGGVFS